MEAIQKPHYEQFIFQYRGFFVMVDSDLAVLYGTSTKALKQQVKRNFDRFPSDFMLELNSDETNELVTNCDRFLNLKHSSVNPLVFTEQGVAMLSSVLRSDKAIKINIEIMRAFARYRFIIKENEQLKSEIQKLDEKVNTIFQYLLDKIDAIHEKQNEPRNPLGFKLP